MRSIRPVLVQHGDLGWLGSYLPAVGAMEVSGVLKHFKLNKKAILSSANCPLADSLRLILNKF